MKNQKTSRKRIAYIILFIVVLFLLIFAYINFKSYSNLKGDNRVMSENPNSNENSLRYTIKYNDIKLNNYKTDNDNKVFRIRNDLKEFLQEKSIVNFNKIEDGNISEFNKLVNFNSKNIDFQKQFLGECWENRPKTFRDLEFVKTKRKSLFKLDETNIKLLKIFDIAEFSFNKKNRIYASEIEFIGKLICNDKVYEYYNSIQILYKVKLKKGNITISNIEQLSANVSAKKIEVEYSFNAIGIQINRNSKITPEYSLTGSGIFNENVKIELDKKIDYFINEIAKKDGAFIGRPFPKYFDIYIKE